MQKTLIAISSMLVMTGALAQSLPHLDPEMTGPEYRAIFDKLEKQQAFLSKRSNDPLVDILNLGKRNLDWIEAINKNRSEDKKIQLTTPETTNAYPIDAPGFSNRDLIQNNLASVKNRMPAAMAEVIFGQGPLPETNPIDDDTFVSFARELNHVYESASRWLLEEPYLEEYKTFSKSDIRGYYFINKETDLDWKLTHWDSLDVVTQTNYSEWLVGECFNSAATRKQCSNQLNEAIKTKDVWAYHQKFLPVAEATYQSFFEVQNPRPEAIWNANNPNAMILPFTTPATPEAADWFKVNVEDEWHVNQWNLQIQYSNAKNLAKVIFEPGATPHVNDLGGDTIVMDANRSLQEYAVRWTIRHEFGHVLGFPDCYVEFYDAAHKVMINYQIDITNLMCSRRGHLQDQHYAQMKKHYYQG